MSDKLTEQQQAELQHAQSFYIAVIGDLKQQVADLADKKAVQVALNAQNQQTIKNLSKQLTEMEQKLIEEKAKHAGPVPKKEVKPE
ncbi:MULTISPECIES: hypothetical protein [Peribacillus]|uniref:hypothetical protein n=1 Tax=Peribacillus TaxID=2675229 RepID=UPI001F4D46EB|nr:MULTISPECIES: hypothetical protein [unclassified Peribacillus]MCK1982238.1 hypothetical protein [Peribacillus sp. Aquil_B1]MCK2007410.1 hypothetical protein [Peribacillus sp. Aquil_B8]